MVFPGTDYHPVLTVAELKSVCNCFSTSISVISPRFMPRLCATAGETSSTRTACAGPRSVTVAFAVLLLLLFVIAQVWGLVLNCRNRTGDAGYASTPLFQCSSCRHNPVQQMKASPAIQIERARCAAIVSPYPQQSLFSLTGKVSATG
jgi:hypothetical protein